MTQLLKAAYVAPIDWTILATYCIGILALAMYFRKRAGKSLESFFVAGRDLPWWVIGFADVAGYTGGGQGFLMVLFLSGFAGLWLMAWISWVIWMPLVAVIWAPMWRRLGVVTTGEFIQRRYAGRRAKVYRSVYAMYACVVWGLTSIAYGAAWMGATAAPVLAWKPLTVVLVFGGFTILYSLISGLLAVAYNDVAQFVILVGGNLAFGLVLLSRAGGWHHALVHVTATRGAGLFSPFPGGKDLNTITLLALVVQGLFFAGSPFAGEGWTAQRFMAARNESHAVRGQIANGVLALVVRLIPFILCAIAAASIYPISQVSLPAALWGDMVKRFAPAGLFGLLLVSSLAGYMAAISSIGNWAASYIVNDLYRTNIRRHAGEKESVLVSRLVSGLLLTAAFLLGGFIRPQDLDKWVLFINSSLIVFSLPLAWLKWFWWRTNAVGDMVGILGGFPAGYLIWFGSDAILPLSLRAPLSHLTGLNWNGIVPAFSDLSRFPFWMGFSVLFFGGTICILLATLLTRPEPMEILESFYKTVRPAGLWGPVRRSLAAKGDEPAANRLGSSLAVSAFGMSFYFFLCIALFALCGDRLILGSCTALVAVALGLLFARRAENELGADKFKTLASAMREVD